MNSKSSLLVCKPKMISFHAMSVSSWYLNLGSYALQRSLIDGTNILFVLCYCIGLAVAGFRKEFGNARRNVGWPSVLSSLSCAILAVTETCTGFMVLYSGDYQLWDWLVPILRGVIWVFLAVSFMVKPNKFVRVLCIIWWVEFAGLTFAFNLETVIRKKNLEIVDLISWPVCLLILVCAIFPPKDTNCNQISTKENLAEPLLPAQDEKGNNFSRAGFLSHLFFLWMNPLLKLGYSKPLKQTDIPLLDPDDGAQEACQRFLTEWNNSKTKTVFYVLFKCFKRDFILTGLYALLRTLAYAASPLLLHAFILYSCKEDNDLYEGFALIVILVLIKIVESLSQRHWFFGSRRLGMKMRSALMAAIFQKQLKLSNKGRGHHSAGEVVNYIGVDAYKLGEFPFWLHIGWSQPIQLVLAIALLFCTVGLGTVPGTVPLVLCALLNIPFAKLLQFYQSKFMVAQDARQRATSEVLNNMKIIKLQSWDEKFKETVGELRDVEVNWLRETQIKKAYGSALYWMSPTFISAVIFAGTAALNTAPLNADVVFTILATLRVMCEPMRMVPEALSILMQVKVSLDRIGTFLVEEELRSEDVNWVCEDSSSEVAVSVTSGDFSWSATGDVLHLRGLNLTIKKGEKVAVCGPVGAGKSSLLCASLGEIPKISGSVEIHGSVAYVSQSPWIQSGTVRDNILFGKPMNELLYQKAIGCCALDKDIENFDHGDLTEIGQRGLNMSGGQRQRLQLARAVYNDADIYLLDDPFSAVDAHTGAVLFNDCVMSALGNKTVILVTHQVEFLAKVDRILVMENGQITQEGSYDQLLKAGTAFEQLVDAHKSSITTLDTQSSSQETIEPKPVKQNSESKITAPENPISTIQLTEEEKMETGNLGLMPYLDYFSVSRGWYFLAMVILCQCIFVTLQCMATYWLAIVVQSGQRATGVAIGVYAGMSTFSCLFAYIRSLLAANLGLKASREFFKGFMNSIFGAPMLFFDSTPSGRIMARASSDMSTLDFDIPYTMTFVISGTIEVLATLIIMTVVTWELVVIAIPAIFLIVYIQRYYIGSARELVRINGTTKAPVMNYAAESMHGALTIRAFRMVERFVHTNMRLIDTDASFFFHTNGALEWVLLHVEVLQILLIVASAVLLILLPKGVVSAGFMGLCLSYALTLSSAQANLTRFYSNLENYIISVERIKQFMGIPPEPPAVVVNNRPPLTWPAEGRIELDNLHVKYREGAPYVLKGITCTFAAGNKVGVVGRTGSGKTTLLSTLFRLVDHTDGRILIDSWDICTIGLRDLRTKLSIIPQEPALFRGTVRYNIDPLGLYSDAEIWEALGKCQLKNTISNLPLQLDSAVADEGGNWSVGQRQLFCLGRVLLKKNKILVLDEATASIDSATDAILQQVIKEEFSGCTVITIAHRVPTVTDSDMVLVLSYGKLVEYDKPSNLTANKDSAFAKLVAEYWSHYSRN